MKIVRVETATVVVPLHEGAWHSAEFVPEGYTHGGQWIRLHWPEFPIVILRLHTDEGLVGLGEVAKGIPEADVRQQAVFFEDRDLLSFNLRELPAETMWFFNPAVYAGYEMALYDLMGKALNVPAYRRFGGKYRGSVPVSRCSGRMTPGDAAKTATACVEQGHSVLKMKATADDPLVERLGAIQDAVGDRLNIVADPNEWSDQPFRLVALVDRLKEHGITNVQCFESPYDQGNPDWYALAHQKIGTPLALHLNRGRLRKRKKSYATGWPTAGAA